MSDSSNLNRARTNKNDEFFTRYNDIHKELKHYKEQFKNKIIYCNTDTIESHFIKYLNDNKQEYQIRAIILCNKDFRSKESIYLLKQADIVITNPPFSLFREYLKQLVDYDKKFLIMGNCLASGYKDLFISIRDSKIKIGYHYGNMTFDIPENVPKLVKTTWFTNLYLNKDKKVIELTDLTKTYNEIDYPKFDDYNAINVDKLKDIPKDYFLPIGVPITYLAKHNDKLFRILGDRIPSPKLNNKNMYRRVMIQRIK